MPESSQGNDVPTLDDDPTLGERFGMTIPLLVPAWLVTYPLRWLLDRQTLVPGRLGLVCWGGIALAFAYRATHPDTDEVAAVVFAVVVAAVFYVVEAVIAPPFPAVRGQPVYLAGPALTAVGALIVGYVVAYRGGLEPIVGLFGADDDS
ncbi:hypothetical protein [Haloarchaeobius baliensis]|uniref:hypothetical protein n=1 Tax=Haloarchaeobius baliensis TaxID=1670458 RepID=UPI003F882569